MDLNSLNEVFIPVLDDFYDAVDLLQDGLQTMARAIRAAECEPGSNTI